MPEIDKLSVRHEAIMQYLIANPTARLRDVAAEFGVTQPWLSCIIHSHAFQTKLRERQDVLFGDIAATITDKLETVAHAALDNIAEHLAASNGAPAFNLEVADKVLNRLGYGTKPAATAAPTQVNVFQVSREELAQARTLLSGGDRPAIAIQQTTGESNVVCCQGSDGSGIFQQPAPVSQGE